jgi:hypothetical protein
MFNSVDCFSDDRPRNHATPELFFSPTRCRSVTSFPTSCWPSSGDLKNRNCLSSGHLPEKAWLSSEMGITWRAYFDFRTRETPSFPERSSCVGQAHPLTTSLSKKESFWNENLVREEIILASTTWLRDGVEPTRAFIRRSFHNSAWHPLPAEDMDSLDSIHSSTHLW